ncbi:MAG: type IIL restriction-modification enzyme MmeI [Deinococcales bacterium]
MPEVSSEKNLHSYGFLPKTTIAKQQTYTLSKASLFDFGVLSSMMHMAWMRYTAGRLKSDYQYSAGIVYNNFPWPQNPTVKQKEAVEKAAQRVLDARANYPQSSLADLYDPLTMPVDLVKAHQALDKAVDRCYRSQEFSSELNRIEYLFSLYESLTAPLIAQSKDKKKPKRTMKS